ncbi:alpha/beta hydrolase family protein [Streptomyces sp. NPDC060194]|uniref:alpha/beta hydrolase family protein n=1 Tax=Streptomyces sp. NPDC060194 TaxID=3347069 RepID=UPI003669775E
MSDDAVLALPPVTPDASAAYGAHPDQVIDFYAPAGTAPLAPLVVAFHGGVWRAAYDRRHLSPFAAHLARRGFAVASVEYRRGGDEEGTAGRWPETFDDVAAAMDALPGLVAAHLPAADPRRTVLTGHSAGGQLALWAAARHELPADAPWRTPRVPALRGVVALAPLADLALARELGLCGDGVLQFLGGDASFDARRPYADPAALVPTGIATTVVQGRADDVVTPDVAESYVAAAAKAGEVVGLTLLTGVGHFGLIDPSADACAAAVEEIEQLAY